MSNGIYLAAKAPFGYRRDEERRLVPDEAEAPLVRELFKRRTDGANYAELQRWLAPLVADLPPRMVRDPESGEEVDDRRRKITKRAVSYWIANRAYVGEMTAQTKRKGQTRVIKDVHPPLVTPEQWEAAQRKQPFTPRNGTASDAELRGMVFCGTCGSRMKTGLSGPRDRRKASYVCTAAKEDCSARASIRTDALDGHVEEAVWYAAAYHEPHVEAVILGDSRYQDAMLEVEEARAAYEEFRDSIEMQRELGMQGFAQGLQVRKEALAVARRALTQVPAPSHSDGTFPVDDPLSRYVDFVIVCPAGIERRGNPPDPRERSYVFFHGAEDPYQPPYFDPADWPEGVPAPTRRNAA